MDSINICWHNPIHHHWFYSSYFNYFSTAISLSLSCPAHELKPATKNIPLDWWAIIFGRRPKDTTNHLEQRYKLVPSSKRVIR